MFKLHVKKLHYTIFSQNNYLMEKVKTFPFLHLREIIKKEEIVCHLY